MHVKKIPTKRVGKLGIIGFTTFFDISVPHGKILLLLAGNALNEIVETRIGTGYQHTTLIIKEFPEFIVHAELPVLILQDLRLELFVVLIES